MIALPFQDTSTIIAECEALACLLVDKITNGRTCSRTLAKGLYSEAWQDFHVRLVAHVMAVALEDLVSHQAWYAEDPAGFCDANRDHVVNGEITWRPVIDGVVQHPWGPDFETTKHLLWVLTPELLAGIWNACKAAGMQAVEDGLLNCLDGGQIDVAAAVTRELDRQVVDLIGRFGSGTPTVQQAGD